MVLWYDYTMLLFSYIPGIQYSCSWFILPLWKEYYAVKDSIILHHASFDKRASSSVYYAFFSQHITLWMSILFIPL